MLMSEEKAPGRRGGDVALCAWPRSTGKPCCAATGSLSRAACCCARAPPCPPKPCNGPATYSRRRCWKAAAANAAWCAGSPMWRSLRRRASASRPRSAIRHAPLLLEEAVTIAREIYLAVRIDGTRQGLELLVAAEGGEDVERDRRAGADCARCRGRRDRGRALSRAGQAVRARRRRAARALCRAPAGDRAARGSGAARDQSARAHRRRTARRLRCQDRSATTAPHSATIRKSFR